MIILMKFKLLKKWTLCLLKKIWIEYKVRVWDLLDGFQSFNIKIVPRKNNQVEDSLAIVASTLQPSENLVL